MSLIDLLVVLSVCITVVSVVGYLGDTAGRKTRCACRHSLAFHDPNTMKCQSQVSRSGAPCSCQQYVGKPPPAGWLTAAGRAGE